MANLAVMVSESQFLTKNTKVHFASDPHFLTVHIVGTEDRNGGWHHVIRERHNFERRVAALEQRLSPFLEARHRNKVLTQREGSRTIMNHT